MVKYSCEQCETKLKKKLIVENKKINVNIEFMDTISNKSPLRYPGGKTRACKILETIMKQHFSISNFNNLISPFFGVVHLNFIFKIIIS